MPDTMHLVGPMERTLFLRSLPVLGDLQAAELAVIAEYAVERHCKKGEVIHRRGERVDAFHIVVEGRVQVEGGEHPAGFEVEAEDQVGLLSLLSQSEEGIDAVASVDSLLLEIDADLLYDLFEEHFYFVHGVIRRLAHSILEERKQIPEGEFLGRRDPLIECPDRPLDFVERVVLVQRGRTFVNSGLDALASLARKMSEVRMLAGTEIWPRGALSGHVLMILSGVVECRQADGRGTFRCGAGYPLGNVESLAGEPRWYDAVAETDIVALRGETETFLDMLEDDFQMACDFLQSFSGGLIETRRSRRGPLLPVSPGRVAADVARMSAPDGAL